MKEPTDLESNFEQTPLEPMVAEHDLLEWLTEESASEQVGTATHLPAMSRASANRLEARG